MSLLYSRFSRWKQVARRWTQRLASLLLGLMLILSCELAWSQSSLEEVVVESDDMASAEVMDLTVYVTHKEAVSFYLDYYPTEVDGSQIPEDLPGAFGEEGAVFEGAVFEGAVEDGLPPAFREASSIGKLEQIMQAMIGCDAEDIEAVFDYGFSLSGYCQALTPDGFQWGGQIDLEPLLFALADMNIDRLTVLLQLPEVGSSVVVPPVKTAVADMEGGFDAPAGGLMAAWVDRTFPTYESYDIAIADPALTKISYSYGFSRQQVLMRLLGLGWALLVPVGLLMWLRVRSLRLYALSSDRTLWFGYQRSVAWIELATWAGWLMVFVGVGAANWLPLLLPSAVSEHVLFGVVSAPLVIVPPLLVGVISRLLSYPVMKEIGQLDYTLPEILIQYVALLGVVLLPLMVFPATQLFYAGYGTWAKVLLVGMAVVFLMLQVSMGRLRDMTPYAITTGELRDRLFTLAKPTGVPLQNIYLLPMRRSRMVNAFAVKNNTVMVTDYLLKQLNKDEVDGIMAHELAHLQLGHPRKLMWQAIVTILDLLLGVSLVLSVLQLAVPGLRVLLVPLTIVIALGLTHSTSRRFEYQADAQAALITGNPKALISGLVKVARLNQMPLQWGKLGESMMTHPSMQRRVLALAQRYDLSTAEVDALVKAAAEGFDAAVSVADETEAMREDRYDLALGNSVDETLPLFSSEFKQKTAGRLSWLIIWGFSIGIVMLGRLAQWLPTPGLQWLGYGLAVAILVGSYRWLLNISPVWGYETLGKQLAARLRSQGFVPSEGAFVGLAPSGELRNYEGHTNWDVGFLFLRDCSRGHQLCYIGEQLKFAIALSQVTRAVVQTDTASLVASARVAITWQGDDLEPHTFILQPLSAQSTQHTRPLSQALKERIETCQVAVSDNGREVGLAGAPSDLFAALKPPVLGDVTSQLLPVLSVGMVVSTWLMFVVIACVIALLTGSLFISWSLSGFILLMATVAAWAQCLPALRRSRQPQQ